jgi:hypothetical protein
VQLGQDGTDRFGLRRVTADNLPGVRFPLHPLTVCQPLDFVGHTLFSVAPSRLAGHPATLPATLPVFLVNRLRAGCTSHTLIDDRAARSLRLFAAGSLLNVVLICHKICGPEVIAAYFVRRSVLKIFA